MFYFQTLGYLHLCLLISPLLNELIFSESGASYSGLKYLAEERIQPTHLTQFYLCFGNSDWLCMKYVWKDQSDVSLQLKYVSQVLDCLSVEFSMLDVSKNGILNKYTLYYNYTFWRIWSILINGLDQTCNLITLFIEFCNEIKKSIALRSSLVFETS